MKHIIFNDYWFFQSQKENGTPREICLPHDAMLEEERRPDLVAGENTGYFPGGKYIYSKNFFGSEKWNDKQVLLRFEGIYRKPEVYLNDHLIGKQVSGYRQMYVDMSKDLKQDEENRLEVRVDNSQTPNSRWYSGSGIYQNVELLIAPGAYLIPDGIKVNTISYAPAKLSVQIEVMEQNCEMQELNMDLLDKQNPEKKVSFKSEKVKDEKSNHVRLLQYEIEIDNPLLWSDEIPNLYQLKMEIINQDGSKDMETLSVGIRHLTWSADTGLCSNGQELKLRGACIHSDNGMLGSCEYKEAAFRRIRILKKAGFNAVRMAHNCASRYLLDACDELGMYMMNEFSDMWILPKNTYDDALAFESEWKENLTDMVRRSYAHPSVVMYSIGNEVADITKREGIEIEKKLIKHLKELDSSIPVTNCIHVLTALSAASKKPLAKPKNSLDEVVDPYQTGKPSPLVSSKLMNMVATFLPNIAKMVKPEKLEKNLFEAMEPLDIVGLNYGNHLSDSLQASMPERLFVHSETYPSVLGQTWKSTIRQKNVVGDFQWTGWDYLGEAGIGVAQYGKEPKRMNKPYPCISAGTGAVNLIGEIEGQGYLNKAILGKEPELYIGVRPVNYSGQKCKMSQWRGTDVINSWSWSGFDNRPTQIEVYTNLSEVELIKDNILIGKQKVIGRKCVFSTVYTPGELKARGFDQQGNCVKESILTTAGNESRIQAEIEKEHISKKDNELLYVHIAITDEKGIVKVTDNRTIKVEVEGSGTLLGVGSGNPITEESYIGDTFTTYYGTMEAVVRRLEENERIRIIVSSGNMEPVVIEV